MVALVVVLAGGSRSEPAPQAAPSPAAQQAPAATVADAAALVLPSTADIIVRRADGSGGIGSGFVINTAGDVVTNAHVVAGAVGPFEVTLGDGSTYSATFVGWAPSYDVAVIRLTDPRDLVVVQLGSSGPLRAGQEVVGIGAPRGLAGTVTSGIVSTPSRVIPVPGADGRSRIPLHVVQVDAALNPGNSGGPLVDLSGRVVGVNAASRLDAQGLNFAIPIDWVKRVISEIQEKGSAVRPVLGVSGRAASIPSGVGVLVQRVNPGSTAERAGLVVGDVVTAVDSTPVTGPDELLALVHVSYAPGQQVQLTVDNRGRQRTVPVTLGGQVDETPLALSGGAATG